MQFSSGRRHDIVCQNYKVESFSHLKIEDFTYISKRKATPEAKLYPGTVGALFSGLAKAQAHTRAFAKAFST